MNSTLFETYNIITGDEKWFVYNNVVRKRLCSKRDEPPQTTSEAEFHQKRLCCLFGGIGKVWYFFAASKEPND